MLWQSVGESVQELTAITQHALYFAVLQVAHFAGLVFAVLTAYLMFGDVVD